MNISGSCHCGNIRFELLWPGSESIIAARRCGCGFCRKHGGVWTSNPEARLRADFGDSKLVSKYRFGTATADFYVCSRCGIAPIVCSEIDGRLYAVVNVNTFDDVGSLQLSEAPTDFESEDRSDRLARRERNWIADVSVDSRM